MSKYRIVITKQADYDLNEIYEEGFNKWGETQADQYFDDILSHFDVLRDNPYLFRAVDEIREGYRRSVCGKHSIFYRVIGNVIEIMALVKYQNRP